MRVEIREVEIADEKSKICDSILRALPNWFAIEASIVDYASGVTDNVFFGAFDGSMPVGFISLKVHNPYTAEIYVMGLLEKCHGQGIGRKLVEICENYCRAHNMEFFTVKTVSDGSEDTYYEKTRLFYAAMGFKPLEVFPLLWDEHNPCLFLAKYVGL